VNIVFAGTPAFAATALNAIVAAGHAVTLVLTQPDRRAGRGRKIRPAPVKEFAVHHGLALLQPATLADGEVAASIREARADAMVVAAYGLIVPPRILKLPRLGCINIHASLLPRWRGAAPIQRALLAGDEQTGITIMQMDEGLDTGPILLQAPLAITATDTAATLHDRLSEIGARLIVTVLASPPAPRPQNPALATYAPKIDPAQAAIRWSDDAAVIERQVRAYNPVPGAHTRLNGMPLKLWRAQVEADAGGLPGTVIAADAGGIVVACGAGALRILELQRAGGKPMAARAFLAGFGLKPGARMGE
jgi:methionyl-tRNA formyltransferase